MLQGRKRHRRNRSRGVEGNRPVPFERDSQDDTGRRRLEPDSLEATGDEAVERDGVTDEPVIAVDASGGSVQVTLFPDSEAPADGKIRRWWINHFAGNNPVTVVVDGGSFADGLARYVLPLGKTVQLGVLNGGGWLRIGDALTTTLVRLATPWPAATWIGPTPVPFDLADRIDNSAVSNWSPFAPLTGNQVKIVLASRYQLSYAVDINSTGGVTWNVTTFLTRNGIEIPGTRLQTGNFGNEDASVSLPPVTVDLDADDSIRLVASQPGAPLTGSMVSAILSVETFV